MGPAARRLAAAFLCCATGLGCGYRPTSLAAPFATPAVVVAPVDEDGVTGLGQALEAQLRIVLHEAGLAVVTRPDPAAGTLRATTRVRSYPGTTLQAVQVYNLDATAEARLMDATGQLRWRQTVAAQESFLPQSGDLLADQPLASETQRHFALDRLAEKLARAVATALQDAAFAADLPPATP